ncbi:unnamed protein product [Ectocarpus sp. 12 AP-2014]
MVYVLDKDGVFECRKSRVQGAGMGVFCVDSVAAGTILPYYGVTIKDDDDDDRNARCSQEGYRTYVVSADYTNRSGNQRTVEGYSVDGDPSLPVIEELDGFKKLACRINEASDGFAPNCLLVSNPAISRAEIKRSLVEHSAIPATFIVTIEDLKRGTELFTCYGDEYGERGYRPSKMKRSRLRQMIDKAYEHVDAI